MAKIPLITIVGVPNTGKSTLFNRLIGKRKALVHSQPGMTRDIYKKLFQHDFKTYYLQDTGGFFLDKDIITEEINKRIYNAVNESDLVIFLFDGKRELLGYEKDLYLKAKRSQAALVAVVNKVDNVNKYIMPVSYYALKEDFILISAEHNHGIEDLLMCIEDIFASHTTDVDNEPETTIRIGIVGKPNVGKSSLINKILNDEYVIVSPLPGTTRDSVDVEIRRKNKSFILVDNAGIRKLQKVQESTESAAVIRAERSLKEVDVLIFVVDMSKKIDQNDLFIAQKIQRSARPVIIAGNKWDLVEEKEQGESLRKKIEAKFNFLYYASFVPTSALTGKNVFQLIDGAEHIWNKISTPIKTPVLNRVLAQILSEKKLITEKNRAFNPKYVSIESYKPLFFRFQSSTAQRLKPSFELYLKRRLIERLDLAGIPVFFNVVAKSARRKK